MSVLAPARVGSATFHCPACQHPRVLAEKHPSGYCDPCMERSRRYWLERFSLAEIFELANLLWPEDFYVEAAA